MRYITDQLREQNNGEAWLDCNERGYGHRWFARHSTNDNTYYGCRRCPVDTLVPLGSKVPPRVLRRG